MNRTACLLIMFTGVVAGCMSEGGPSDPAPWAAQPNHMGCMAGAGNSAPPGVPGTMAWNGAPQPVAAPYTSEAPRSLPAARAQMWNSVPLDMVQQAQFAPPQPIDPSLQQRPGLAGNGGAPNGQQAIPYMPAGGGCYPPGVVAGVGMILPGSSSPFRTARTEIRFSAPSGMKVTWFSPGQDGKNANTTPAINIPGRYNFLQGAIYRLKLMDIPGRQGLELYPTLEVVPTNARTNEFLSHSAVPLTFTDEDFDQVVAGNFVVKVIYLPNPQNQELAAPGQAGEIISTRLEPGVNPIALAASQGDILMVIRMGNIDLEAPNTPAMDAPNPFAPKQQPAGPPMGPGGMMMNPMMPGFADMMGGMGGAPGMMPPGPMGTGYPGPMTPGGGMPFAPGAPGAPAAASSPGQGAFPVNSPAATPAQGTMLPPVQRPGQMLPPVSGNQGSAASAQPVMFQGGSSGGGFFPLNGMK